MKRLVIYFLLAFLVFNISVLNAQTHQEMEEYFEEGQYFFNREEYLDALSYYQLMFRADSTNANINFKIGECYLNIEGSEHLAIPYLERAVKRIVPKNRYRRRAFDEKAAPLHAYFYLGQAYRMDNKLNEALECYMKFIDSPFFYDNYNQNVVDREIKSCERAAIIRDTPVEHEKILLSKSINTEFDEEKPVVSADGKTLVFVRKLQFYDAVFCSRYSEGEWQDPININPQILSDGEYYPTGLSADGKQLLLIRKLDDNYDIYSSSFDGETWSEATKMSGALNSMFAETHASFGPEGNTIFVTSNRKGGRGGFDIWVSHMNKNGEWGKLKNLGKQINTELDEQMARACADPELLFFSSQGHYTMGGYDIFYSRKDGKKWKVPVNLGYPINNTRNNLNYCPNPVACREGYYSIRSEDKPGDADIYLYKITSDRVLYFSLE